MTIADDAMSEGRSPVRVTAAQGLLLLVLLLGAVMRLSALDGFPLSPGEVEEALPIWQFGEPGSGGAPFSGSPAYFSLTLLLTGVAGFGEGTLRLLPALAGTLLVALPWLWRARLGDAGALTTSVLLAVSPVAAIVARTAGGDALAAVAILLLLIAWSRYREGGRPAWLYAAAGALGLGAASAPLFYSGLITLALARLAQKRFGPTLPPTPSPNGQTAGGQVGRNALLVGAATFVASATLFFWHPAGVGQAASQLGAWAGNFSLSGGAVEWLAPILLLGRYESAALLLGIGAIVWATWQGHPADLFLVYWFAAAIVVALLQHGSNANVLLLALPLYLLLGRWTAAVFARPAGNARWGLLPVLLILGSIVYYNSARYLRVMVYAPDQLSFLLLAALAVILALIAWNVVRTWDGAAAAQGALLTLLLIFSVYQWGTAWWLTHQAANDPRALWVDEGTDDDLWLLATILSDISQQTEGSNQSVEIVAAVESPLLRWHLREFPNARFGGALPPGVTAPVVITPAMTDPALGENYFGMDLGLRHTGIGGTNEAPGSALRWWLFHDSPARPAGERIILWVRNDARS